MEIILLERVEKLGQIGDVVNVKNGFARNYLLPNKKALRATKANLAFFETQRKEIEAQNLAARKDAEAVAAKMNDLSVVLLRQAGESGQLYGSVTSRDIAVEISEAGFKVVRSQVILPMPIKTIGLIDVTVRLHAEVSVTVTVNVARSAEEAELQAAGKDLTADAEEVDLVEAALEEVEAMEAAEEAVEVEETADEAVEDESKEA